MFNKVSHIVKTIAMAISCAILIILISPSIIGQEIEEEVCESVEMIITSEVKFSEKEIEISRVINIERYLPIAEVIYYKLTPVVAYKSPFYILYSRLKIGSL